MTFKPRPEISVQIIGIVPRLLDAKGNDIMRTEGGPEMLAECWNALRKFYAPAAHVDATEEQVKRLEELRKAAWARVKELEPALLPTSERTQ